MMKPSTQMLWLPLLIGVGLSPLGGCSSCQEPEPTDTPSPTATATLFACHPPGSVRQRIVVHLELSS